jgi:hypothetical protein
VVIVGYVVGVSSGLFSAAPEGDRLQYVGLPRKAMYSITKGVQFVQIDLESVSEFRDPELEEGIKKVERMGITFGIHSETKAFGVEIAELDSSIETDYKFGHERLLEIFERAGRIKSKYVLIHSSESEPFLFLERHLQPSALVDFFGNPLREFVEKNTFLLRWLLGGEVEEVAKRVFEMWKEKGRNMKDTDVSQATMSQEYMWRDMFGRSLGELLKGEIESRRDWIEIQAHTKYENLSDKDKQYADDHIQRELLSAVRTSTERFLIDTQSRTLHYGPERVAYYFIAKLMETNKDPLWENIVNATINYFAKVDDKKREDWLKEKGIEKLSIDDENFRKYNYLWVAAVSGKYLWGHLNQDKNPDKRYPDLKPTLKKYNMPLVLETPMAHRGVEEWLRLPNPIQMYYIVKEIGPEYVAIAMDFEHMISIKLEPEKVIESLPEDGGEFVLVIHAGWPAPLAPSHLPIPLGSEQQMYLYKMLYKLRQKGFGKKKKDHYIIFERGGGADPIQQSVLALKAIVEQLVKDTPWDKLPLEFHGISPQGFLSPERQRATIFEHRFEPLKGMIVMPEEEYTFLGKAALEKGKRPDEWKKEELR